MSNIYDNYSTISEKYSYLIFISMLLFTLNTYYFYGIGFPIVQMIGLVPMLLLVLIMGINYLKVKNVLLLLSGFIVYVVGILIISSRIIFKIINNLVLIFLSVFGLLHQINNRYRFLTFMVLVLVLLNNSSVITSFFFWSMLGLIFKLTKKQDYKNGTTL